MRSNFRNQSHSFLLFFALALILTAVLMTTGCSSARMSGSSMEPTLHNGDTIKLLAVDRVLNRGDIAFFSSPDNPSIDMAKRIVGLPGETFEVKNGQVLTNGAALNETYIAEAPSYEYGPVIIPEKSYIILGDNRNHSSDSHNFGNVPLANIKNIVEIK